MRRSTCLGMRSKPARNLNGPVRGEALFGTWRFMCFSFSTCIFLRKMNRDSVRRHRSVLVNSMTRLWCRSPPYRKDELRGYLEHCRRKLDAVLAGMTEAWASEPCPFEYRAMSNGELLLY